MSARYVPYTMSTACGRWLFSLLLLCLLAACASTPEAPRSTGILMFGDSGYHLNYLDADDYEEKFTVEEFKEYEWTKWQQDKRPIDEYEARPYALSPATGGVVAATGMQQISTAMKNFCRDDATCDFGFMLGDNIYPDGATMGTDGVSDEGRFKHMISDPFGDLVSQPEDYITYSVMGNHDWYTSREGGFAQIAFLEQHPGFYMNGPYYTVKPTQGNDDIELFIIDTNMILATVTVMEDGLNADGTEAPTGEIDIPDYDFNPMTAAEKAMPQWLEEKLRESTAKWKFVVAHHPIWSSAGSKFEQARELRKLILPAMCRYADAYFVGHEHTMEIHEDDCSAAIGEATDPPLVQIVSGAASKQRALNSNFIRQQGLKYPELTQVWAKGQVWGFAHMTVQGDTATVSILSVPDDGSSEHSIDFEYKFQRRSHRMSANK